MYLPPLFWFYKASDHQTSLSKHAVRPTKNVPWLVRNRQSMYIVEYRVQWPSSPILTIDKLSMHASHHGLASTKRVPYLTNFWLIWLLFFLFILGSRALRTAVIQVATIKKNGWWNWMSRFACSLTAVYIWLRILLSPSIHFNFNNASQSVESFLSILRKYDSDLEAFPFRYRLFVCTMSLSNIETNWD